MIDFSANLVAQTVKRLPVMRETQVRPLGWEDPLEKVGWGYRTGGQASLPWDDSA